MKKFPLFVLALLSSAVFAQALPTFPGASPVYPYTMSGNVATFGGATATAANASSITFGNAANAALYAQAQASVPVGGGAYVPTTVKAFPTPYAISRAVGTFLGKVLPFLCTGIALYELAKELGFDLNNSSGAVVVKKSDPTLCTVAPCYLKKLVSANYGTYTANTVQQVAAAMQSGYNAQGLDYLIASFSVSGISVTFIENKRSTGAYYTTRVVSASDVPIAPSVPVFLPSTIQELQDAIAAKSGWPSPSALPQTLKDAVTAGVPLELPSPSQITGPASVPLSPMTVTHPDGSQTVTQPNKNVTYGPNTVTSTDSTTVTELNPSGTPVAPPTTTTKPSDPPQTCGYPGGPPCKIDESGTPDKIQEKDYNPKADQLKTNKDAGLDKIAGTADKSSLYNNYSVFFRAPAFVACEPIPLPAFKGVSMGAIDACSVVDGMREVMGYLWALGGLFLCLGFIRQTV